MSRHLRVLREAGLVDVRQDAGGSGDPILTLSEISLSGMTEATLGVSQLTADGIACGLDLAQIGEATHHILADAGLGLHDAADDRITVSAISARVGPDQCATAVMLGAYAKESFFSRAAGWVQSGYVVMWQRSAMVATPIGEHASRVLDATRRVAREMLADWQAQNRTPMAANPDNRNLSAGNAAIPIKRTP